LTARTAAAVLALLGALATAAQASSTYTCVAADGRKTFSDRPCPAGSQETARPSGRVATGAAVSHGLTFGLLPAVAPAGATDAPTSPAGGMAPVVASCHATPEPADRPRAGSCDPYRGDTACSRSLPLLCFREAQRRAREPTRIDARSGRVTPPTLDAQHFDQLGSGPRIAGERLSSPAVGSQLCEQALGPGWRMARFHERGGWQIPSHRHASLPTQAAGRFWVAIDDQPGNCWNPAARQVAVPPSGPSAAGAPAVPNADERQLLDELRRIRSSGVYAKLSAQCRGLLDRVERSLRAAPGAQGENDGFGEPAFDLLLTCSDEMSRHSPEPQRPAAR
jgi:Domain of unknown function (DUF4124)